MRPLALLYLAGCTWLSADDYARRTDADLDGVAAWDDCDDDDPLVYPGAEELCDGTDDDCTGDELGCTTGFEGASAMVSGSTSGGSFGSSIAAGDWNGDGVADLLVGAEYDDALVNDGGAAWLLAGPLGSDALGVGDAALALYGDQDTQMFGTSAAMGDLNDDGLSDAVIGAHKAEITDDTDAEIAEAGLVCVSFGRVSGAADGCDLLLRGSAKWDRAGRGLAVADDLTGDGLPDLIVGAYGYRPDGTNVHGRVFVVEGPLAAGDLDLASNATASVVGAEDGDWIGEDLLGSDLDGDGLDELVIGCPACDNNGVDSGAAWIVPTLDAGATGIADLGVALMGDAPGDLAGAALASGDINGDGVDDLLVSAPELSANFERAGVVYLIPGDASWGVDAASVTLANVASASLLGGADDQELADSLSAVADVDGSGRDDVLIGTRSWDPTRGRAGGALLLLDPPDGSWTVDMAAAIVLGDDAAELGDQVLLADLSGDGGSDVVLAAPGWTNELGTANPGAVFVFSGLGRP